MSFGSQGCYSTIFKSSNFGALRFLPKLTVASLTYLIFLFTSTLIQFKINVNKLGGSDL